MFRQLKRIVIALILCGQLCGEEIDFPEGIGLAEFCEEDFEEPEDFYFDKAANETKDTEQEPNLALSALEAGPSAFVANCVSAISGAFMESQTDLIVPGAQPLMVQRTYSSTEKKWHFRYQPLLKIGVQKGKTISMQVTLMIALRTSLSFHFRRYRF